LAARCYRTAEVRGSIPTSRRRGNLASSAASRRCFWDPSYVARSRTPMSEPGSRVTRTLPVVSGSTHGSCLGFIRYSRNPLQLPTALLPSKYVASSCCCPRCCCRHHFYLHANCGVGRGRTGMVCGRSQNSSRRNCGTRDGWHMSIQSALPGCRCDDRSRHPCAFSWRPARTAADRACAR
jgi:hypothetical protein